MVLKKNRPIVISISSFIIFALTLLLCGCQLKNTYKYNGEIYEDSYEYKEHYGYQYLEKTNDKLAKLYEELYLKMTDFYHKDQDANKKTYYKTFYEGNFSDGNYTKSELYQCYMYFTSSNPKFYWMNYYFEDSGKYYFGVYKDYIKSSVRKKYDQEISEGLEKIDELVLGIDDEFLKIKTISDYIIKNMSYAYDGKVPSDEQWAHSIIGFFDKNSGVCETYAKVFKLLCDRYNIGNLPVLSSSHIWNLVSYEDEWYVFDLTYDEGTYDYFGKTEEECNDGDHTYDKYLYELPDNMAKTPLSLGLIELKEDDKVIYSSYSMDSINSKFNNGNYEIVMNCNDQNKTQFYVSTLDSNYNSLTITSNQTDSERMSLYLTKDITLTKDLTIKNIYITSSKERLIILEDANIYATNSRISPMVRVIKK